MNQVDYLALTLYETLEILKFALNHIDKIESKLDSLICILSENPEHTEEKQ